MVRGFTLLELVAALVVMVLAIGGTLTAFLTADRVSQHHNQTAYAEASGYAQQTAERFRNRIAADSPWRTGGLPSGWQDDAFAGQAPEPPSPSIRRQGATRRYRVTPQDCDRVGGVGDCYAIEVKVCWDDPACAG